MVPADATAQKILALIEATYQPNHHYVTVDARTFRHLDLKFYDSTAHKLANKGFRTLADVEDTTISATPGGVLMPVLIRTLLSKDGTVMAALYHPRIKPLVPRLLLWVLRKLPAKVVDMETEFSDGSFVLTSNAASAAAIELPSLISVEYMPKSATAHQVAHRHSLRVTAHLALRHGITAKVVRTHEELVASQNRMNAIKAAFRNEIDGVTREELERLSILGPSVATEVHDAIGRERIRRAG